MAAVGRVSNSGSLACQAGRNRVAHSLASLSDQRQPAPSAQTADLWNAM